MTGLPVAWFENRTPPLDTRQLTDLIAHKFVARTDVKAIQHPSGDYTPHEDTIFATGEHVRIPWRRRDFEAHIDRRQTFGHYLLNTEGYCKLFAFDIDLHPAGFLPQSDPWADEGSEPPLVEVPNLRTAWLDRANPARTYMKYQFRQIVNELITPIVDVWELRVAVTYSGCKGVHVYAFFDKKLSGDDARKGAIHILDLVGAKLAKGKKYFQHEKYPNLSIEVYPKQSSLEGKDVGNLMRLPLGRNWRAPNEPTFFVDMTAPLTELRPVDPIWALTTENPWTPL